MFQSMTRVAAVALLVVSTSLQAKAPDPARAQQEVKALTQAAITAFTEKRYDDTIRLAKRIQAIPIEGQVRHINDAQQIIDNARQVQKEETAPKRGLTSLKQD